MMKYIFASALAMVFLNICPLEIARAKRKLECQFLKAARDYGFAHLLKEELKSTTGANVDALDVYGQNALHLGLAKLETREDSFFDTLFALGISTTHQDSRNGNTPLHTFLESLITLCSYASGSYVERHVKKELSERVAKKLMAITPKNVLTTPNYLGKIPYDYLDHEKINILFPNLKTLLKPQALSIYKPAVPRLLSAPFIDLADVPECLKTYIDRMQLSAILHELKIIYRQNVANATTANTRKNVGRKVLRFLSTRDHLIKHLLTHLISQPEIAHQIAWHQQFDPELTDQEKSALIAMRIVGNKSKS